jgi:DNA ligase-associated metallophosphoesterase
VLEGAVTVEAGAESLTLLPQRAAYWARRRTLFVADVHLGKAASFRRAAIPVPRGSTAETLDRLAAAVAACGAERLVVLGDLVHDATARAAAERAFLDWRERHAALDILLVAGNHDRRGGGLPERWRVRVVDEPYCMEGYALCHEPQAVGGAYALAGHLHPGVKLVAGRDRLRLPCFWLRPEGAVLPAFGAFTGLANVVPRRDDRVYVAARNRVVAVA